MLLESLGLPASTNIHINIPKKVLKKYIDDDLLNLLAVTAGKTQLFDVALIAPRSCHIPEYADAQYHCREIHVLYMEVNSDNKLNELETELFKAVPYAIILIVRYKTCERFVLADFRTNQNDKSRYVINETIHSQWLENVQNTSLPTYASLPKTNLLAFYRAFVDILYLSNAKTAWPDAKFNAQTARNALWLKNYYQTRLDRAVHALNVEAQIHHQLEYRQQIREYYDKIVQIPTLTSDALDEQVAQLTTPNETTF